MNNRARVLVDKKSIEAFKPVIVNLWESGGLAAQLAKELNHSMSQPSGYYIDLLSAYLREFERIHGR